MRGKVTPELIAILRRAHAGELAAALAYEGHARSLVDDPTEAEEVSAIAVEEWEHRRAVRKMLEDLGARPRRLREALFRGIGLVIGVLCRVGGWLLPMYGAGRLESGNIREYDDAAGLAILAGHGRFVPELLRMAEVEWEHERYFRAKVVSCGLMIPLWPKPASRDSIGPKLPRGLRRELGRLGGAPCDRRKEHGEARAAFP